MPDETPGPGIPDMSPEHAERILARPRPSQIRLPGDLTELEALAQAATPGPWREGWLGTVLDDSGKAVCQRAYDDAAFIAAARDAVPALIARVRKAEAEGSAAHGVIDAAHLERKRAWSRETFGPGPRTAGIIAHIRKELDEVAAVPDDVEEWVDVVILALDGAWRAGHEPQEIIDAILAKQAKNEARSWPDWRTTTEDEPIEHVVQSPLAGGDDA